ncbi:MAG: carbon monoxide dehydrogenase, partial [Euryarchaeota archaeon]|nr:carbon monoxide dehydrogenase [Euryarchaeota archaeon]
MTITIAVAGKGGVGKSTISALLVMALAERSGEVVLAVDADPNSNLGDKLGVKVGKTLGDLREDLLRKADEIPAGTSKQEFVKYQIQLAMVEGSSFDLLTMGRPEGPGCYCYINNILRVFLDTLIDEYEFVIIDNEAGMEHLSRRTTRKMDALFLVSDATKVGIETAVRLHGLAREMKIQVGRTMLIVNKAAGELHPTVS